MAVMEIIMTQCGETEMPSASSMKCIDEGEFRKEGQSVPAGHNADDET